MISKEILSEVLNEEIQEIDTSWYQDNYIRYFSKGKDYLINKYELAFKCKEWALDKGFWISSTAEKGTVIVEHKANGKAAIFDGNTELANIFNAVKWVYKKKETI